MKNRPTEFGTVAGMTALIGMFPLLITGGIAYLLLEHGARDWPDWLFAGSLMVLQLGLMACGTLLFRRWFG